jgi:hypothetical protein
MTSKKLPIVGKPTKKVADVRNVRFGSGMAPATIRSRDAQTHDAGRIRFGSGMAPAILRK